MRVQLRKRLERARRPRRGQALVEFALVAPVMVLLFVATLEASLLMFSRSTAEFAAGEAARIAAQAGNATSADSLSVQSVRDSSLGHTKLASINEVDIYRLAQDPNTGAITVDSAHVNQYRLDGTVIGTVNWPSATRNVSSSSADLIGITIDYTYPWQTGLLGSIPSPHLKAIYYLRLEPQVF